MIDLLEGALRRARILFFLSLMVLAACGPGSGGTGTGPQMALKFSGSAGGGGSGGAVDPSLVLTVNLRIEDGIAELTAGDLLIFKGEWGEPATDSVVLVPGSAELPDGPRTAVLRLEFNGEPQSSPSVTVSITSAEDPRQVLLDPFTLALVSASSRSHP